MFLLQRYSDIADIIVIKYSLVLFLKRSSEVADIIVIEYSNVLFLQRSSDVSDLLSKIVTYSARFGLDTVLC